MVCFEKKNNQVFYVVDHSGIVYAVPFSPGKYLCAVLECLFCYSYEIHERY